MAKYRKKPIVIEAFRMGIDPQPDWFVDKVINNEIITNSDDIDEGPFSFRKTYCDIKTLEGVMRGDFGDYIIQGIQGEVYPCKIDIFEQTYEPVK